MIGIGVTTYNRPQHLQHFVEQIEAHTENFKLYIARDTTEDRKGVAARKNECLKNLKDCKYIFLFDDDCFPIKNEWDSHFIQAHLLSGEHHFLYLRETAAIRPVKTEAGIIEYSNCGGCMMFLTQKVINKVGGFNKDYGLYGYEHAGYSSRIHQAGLTSAPYLCPKDSHKFIYSMDYDHYLDFPFTHVSSMRGEFDKVEDYVKSNSLVFLRDKEIYQPL